MNAFLSAAAVAASGSLLEWTACLVAAVASVLAYRRDRRWLLAAFAALLGAWILGTAKGLLAPAVLGVVAMWICARFARGWRTTGLVTSLGGASFSAILCWIFPLPVEPPLTGPYAVGTATHELPAVGNAPPLVVQAWYPTRENVGAPRAPWLDDRTLAPKFPFHRQAYATARALVGAPLPENVSPYPVIFYEHAWNGHRQENVAQVEDLASQGFVVIAIDHPGQAGHVRYADGSVVKSRLAPSFELLSQREVDDFEELAGRCLDERMAQLNRVKASLGSGQPAIFSGRLNLSKTGIFGFSFGGTSALHCCAEDASFYAGANEDGMFLGDKNPRGPFLFFDEQMPSWLLKPAGPHEGPEDAQTRRCEEKIRRAMNDPDRYRVILDGTLHPAFMDRIFTCRIPWLARVGTRPAAEVHQEISQHLTRFFRAALLGLRNDAPIFLPEAPRSDPPSLR